MYISELMEEIGYGDLASDLWEYLLGKEAEEIALSDIFEETNLSNVKDFRMTEEELVLQVEGFEINVPYAVEMIINLALLVLESEKSGVVDFEELNDSPAKVKFVTTSDEMSTIKSVLEDFVESPMEFDLAEMMSEDEMSDMAAGCRKLLDELK